MSQTKWGGRVVAGVMLLAAILARPEAASAQLDPLLMIKKGTPATPVKLWTAIQKAREAS